MIFRDKYTAWGPNGSVVPDWFWPVQCYFPKCLKMLIEQHQKKKKKKPETSKIMLPWNRVSSGRASDIN